MRNRVAKSFTAESLRSTFLQLRKSNYINQLSKERERGFIINTEDNPPRDWKLTKSSPVWKLPIKNIKQAGEAITLKRKDFEVNRENPEGVYCVQTK